MKINKRTIYGFLALVIAFLTIVPSIRIIGPTETAVVVRFGSVVNTLESGIAWQFWLTDRLIRFDLTMRETELHFSAHSVDAQNINGHITVQWNVQPRQVEQIVREFGTLRNLEDRIDSIFMQEVQSIFGRHNALWVIENREALRESLEAAMRIQAPGFRINVENALIADLEFSQTFRNAVDARIEAEQNALRAQAEAERNVTIAAGVLEVRELESQAVLVQARADAEALAIMQDAWGDLGAEIREIMLRQLAIEAWNGVLPTVLAGSDFSLILDSFTAPRATPTPAAAPAPTPATP